VSEHLRALFGERYLDPGAWAPFAGKLRVKVPADVPAPRWSDDFLTSRANGHMLVFAPSQHEDGEPITLNSLRACFGIDPVMSEPCFYNQDWYLKEDFAARQALEPGWHLFPVSVLEKANAKGPQEVQKLLEPGEQFSLAVNYTFAFFLFWLRTGGKLLWGNNFIWCRDRDHNGDCVYIGRYEDPAGINKKGFEIHRHLSLRNFHTAAPEVI
jgi:hypothetical protein